MQTDLQVWLDHFLYHAGRRSPLPEGDNEGLTAYERRLIADSIATFQLGEQSEGRTLLQAAERFERAHGAEPLARIVQLFISEEQHHAALLGEFMDQHGIARKHSDWTDHVFRWARRLAGFELSTRVLITAELIGIVYYRALERATGCRQLQSLCRILVADELAHVGFESDVLKEIQARRAPVIRAAVALAHGAFLRAVSLVVWLTHRRVLRGAGHSLRTFRRACRDQYTFHLAGPILAARPVPCAESQASSLRGRTNSVPSSACWPPSATAAPTMRARSATPRPSSVIDGCPSSTSPAATSR